MIALQECILNVVCDCRSIDGHFKLTYFASEIKEKEYFRLSIRLKKKKSTSHKTFGQNNRCASNEKVFLLSV